jgi:hypothetical protein
LALLGLQLIAMTVWSTIIWSHFSLVMDYVQYHTAWWLIGHGNLNPVGAFIGGHRFWQNNFELIMWPLAMLEVIAPHGPVLGIVMDASVAIAETVAFSWMCELAETRLTGRTRQIVVVVGLVLLVANPWSWQAISFDFHIEPLGICFLILAARSLTQEKRSGWLWALLAAACGDATAALLTGLGIGMVMAVPRAWRRALGVVATGAGFLAISVALHGDAGGSSAHLYGYLAGTGRSPTLAALVEHVITHPSLVVSALLSHRTNIYANIAPGGIIGIANPLVLGVWIVNLPIVYLTHGNLTSQPLFQQIALYVLVPLGSVSVLIALLRRYPRSGRALAGLLAANALAWSIVWAPIIYHRWLVVPDRTAIALRSIQEHIPPQAEVVVSFGVSGRFSDRRFDYPIYTAGEVVPIRNHDTYWIVAPWAGAEAESPATALKLIADLAGNRYAHLMAHRAGVWAFHWKMSRNIRHITTPAQPTVLPGWTSAGPAGHPDLTGTPAQWTAAGSGSRGCVASGDDFFLPPAMYSASVTLSANVPVDVEVWNDTGNVLLARHRVGPTRGQQTVRFTVNAKRQYPDRIPTGYGPFTARMTGTTKTTAGDIFEIRVCTSGSGRIRVSTLSLQHAV